SARRHSEPGLVGRGVRPTVERADLPLPRRRATDVPSRRRSRRCARGKTKNALQVLSTVTNYSVEDVASARGGPGWFQLYSTSDWPSTQRMLKRAEDAGCKAVAWTVDIPVRNLEPVARFDRDKEPLCQACHAGMPANAFEMRHMFDGVDMTKVRMGLAGLT